MLILVNLKVLPNNTYESMIFNYFANINFREFVSYKYFANTNFREFVTFKYFAKTYFREFVQNSRLSRKLIFAKINPLKVYGNETYVSCAVLSTLTSGQTLLDNIVEIIGSISNLSEDKLVELLLYRNEAYSIETITAILKCTIIYLKSSERFDIPLI